MKIEDVVGDQVTGSYLFDWNDRDICSVLSTSDGMYWMSALVCWSFDTQLGIRLILPIEASLFKYVCLKGKESWEECRELLQIAFQNSPNSVIVSLENSSGEFIAFRETSKNEVPDVRIADVDYTMSCNEFSLWKEMLR